MACTCTIAAIEQECGRNAPSMKAELYVTCLDQITEIGAATSHAVSTITMRAYDAGPPEVTAGVFYLWQCSRRDIEFSSTQDENGLWTTTGRYFIPKQTSAKASILNNLGEENNVLICTDMNGAKRIVGALDNPATIRVNETSTPRNGYEVNIQWESQESPYFYTGSITT